MAPFFQRSLLPCFALLALLLSGCGRAQNLPPDHLVVLQGEEQCLLPGEKSKRIIVRLEYANGKPASDIPLEVKAPDLKIDRTSGRTDAGGIFEFSAVTGRRTGDNLMTVTAPGHPQVKPLTLRLVNGLRLTGSGQEGYAGKTLKDPLTILITDGNAKPLAGIPVFVTPAPECRAQVTQDVQKTDGSGQVSANVRLPGITGRCAFQIEVSPHAFDNPVRSLRAVAMSLDLYNLCMNVLGGLAFFIFGMKLMSGGLEKLAGDRLKTLLHYCTGNRFLAIGVGAFITAVLQSSSATTVMVVGFVNAGLLNLAQSIGIIFGAHIGTTITAQIIAFNVSLIIMPAIISGLIFTLLPRQTLHGWGNLILGFGLIFFGMELMSGDLKVIGNFPTFISFFHTFDCAPVNGWMPFLPLLGAIGIGLVATMIVQSSAAVAGIVIALGAGQLINLYTAVALILGSNVGTTVTAQLAALPANRLAKQTALAHTLTNAIGVLVLVATFYLPWGNTGIPVFFYVVDTITAGNAFAEIPQNLPRHIANAHTLFNVFTTLLLVPFIAPLANLCSRLIPVGEGKTKYQLLEPHLLNRPAVALSQATFALEKMLKKSWKMTDRALNKIFVPVDLSTELADKIAKQEERVDRYQKEISEYLSQMMRRPMPPAIGERIPVLMHCTNDAERIGDRAVNIAEQAKRLAAVNEKLSPEGAADMARLFDEVREIYEFAADSLLQPAPDAAKFAKEREKRVLALCDELENSHVLRMREGRCTAETGVIFAEVIGELAAITRHLCNICERSGKVGAIPGLKKRTADQTASR